MSAERLPLLTQAVAADYPGYSDIAVSFPDRWELVREIRAARLAGAPQAAGSISNLRSDHY